jgi:hypothetical protein
MHEKIMQYPNNVLEIPTIIKLKKCFIWGALPAPNIVHQEEANRAYFQFLKIMKDWAAQRGSKPSALR